MLDLTVMSVWHVTSIWLGTCPGLVIAGRVVFFCYVCVQTNK